jgi:uroporphyrinogen-III decarboxylase
MTGLERTLAFIEGRNFDHPPFHPIIMRWAAKYAGVKYRDFCIVPSSKCQAMMRCAEDFDIDWVTVMSDPWAEASAFGIVVEYPEDSLPVSKGGQLPNARSASLLHRFDPRDNERCRNRLAEIREYRKKCADKYLIVGWVEGAVAEYVDLRGASNASVDFLLDPGSVSRALDIINECAMEFISLQVREGAHCIGIGDAFCSQVGPDIYNEFGFLREKILVDHIHNLGALAKLHICGDTSDILQGMIKTGADIIDSDHLVPDLGKYASLLDCHQVFSGKSDPVSVIQDSDPETIYKSVSDDYLRSGKRCIVSAGCEITPDTSTENMRIFSKAAKSVG